MTVRLVVFDLDGTLLDGYAAIEDALAYAMTTLGKPPLGPADVRRMVGHGLERLLEQAVGPDRAAEGVRLFRERYPEVAVSKSKLMPGARGVLETLAAAGFLLALASNKPARFSRMILEAKGVAPFFLTVEGPAPGVPAKPDPAMLERAMRRGAARPDTTVAVGDMDVDAEFARAAGCRVVLIPRGSRTRAELETAGADALLSDLRDLPAWLASRAAPRAGARG